MKLVLVRHPETTGLREDIIYGRIDMGLSEDGKKEIPWAADRLAHIPFDACYCSPLSRARMLCDGIAERHPGLQIQTDERILEMSLGIFEGLSMTEAEEKYPGRWKRFYSDYGNMEEEGCETFVDVSARAKDFIGEITEKYTALEKEDGHERTILVVSHAMIMRGMLNALFGLSLHRIYQMCIEPTCIIAVRVDAQTGYTRLLEFVNPSADKPELMNVNI